MKLGVTTYVMTAAAAEQLRDWLQAHNNYDLLQKVERAISNTKRSITSLCSSVNIQVEAAGKAMGKEKVVVFELRAVEYKLMAITKDLGAAEDKLSKEVNQANEVLADLTSLDFPHGLKEALDRKFESYSSGLAEYISKVASQIGEIGTTMGEVLEAIEKVEKVSSSRDSSRDRGAERRPLQFLHREHLLPPLFMYEKCK